VIKKELMDRYSPYMTYVFLHARTKWNKYDIEQFREDELEAKVFLYNELYRRLKILEKGCGGKPFHPFISSPVIKLPSSRPCGL